MFRQLAIFVDYRRLVASIALVSASVMIAPNILYAEKKCTPLHKEIPLRSTLASAGFFANFRNAENSVSYQMEEMLSQGYNRARQTAAREHHCQHPCSDAVVAVVFKSIPHRTLADYDEYSTCQHLYNTTKRKPISFENRMFASEEDVKDWYDDVTRGNGTDGAQLYEQCPGKCSPAYTSITYEKSGHYIVSASIICGHARDKSDDQYRLTTSLQWICPKAQK